MTITTPSDCSEIFASKQKHSHPMISDLKLVKESDQNVSMCTEVRICVTVRENRFYLNRHTHTLSELQYVLLKQQQPLDATRPLLSTLCSPSMVCTRVASHIEWTRPNNSQAVKFKYCEKATKFAKNLHLVNN